ncbi:MAG: hypothetical protein U0169_04150 [Polyangiaceae bacterium]
MNFTPRTTFVAAASGATVFLALAAACGTRTDLGIDELVPGADVPGGDAAPGTDAPVSLDATTDATADGDARLDAPTDVVIRDSLVPFDAPTDRIIDRSDCPDAASTLVYVVTTSNELLSFFPPTGAFRRIGILACPNANGATPFSMAVDRRGVANVLFSDGRLFRVSTVNAACTATTFQPRQQGFETFGMGFATNEGGPSETLFIAADGSNTASGLATIDSQLRVNPIGSFVPNIARAELTGTGDGRLFAFFANPTDSRTFIAEIEKTTARVAAQTSLPGVDLGNGWAFAFWGGDFYLFTAPAGSSTITRYRPTDGSLAAVARYPSVIVGAGVSTCAPQ